MRVLFGKLLTLLQEKLGFVEELTQKGHAVDICNNYPTQL
jgi:hypothetical protein